MMAYRDASPSGCAPEGDPARQYDWGEANVNLLTSVEKLGREFGTPNLKGLPCRLLGPRT